ncbi:ABC transporter permease [Hydrogenoanaerobacterium sp.]|uniref:ABC transporter permease n=1 Tax=Hydrogenoanaerobacterium sp. TaxID=2953763 RepID=UPI00289B9AF1|nr:ABC transporter permease [Hydrogenoanaerobacterium sp.]
MKTFDLISMCFRNLFRRKMRTVLTVLGVVIGTCAIIVTVSLGLGMTKIQEDALAQMGDLTKIDIYNRGGGGKDAPVLDDKVLKQISEMEGVEVATPLARADWSAMEFWVGDKFQFSGQVMGIYPEAMEKLGYTMKEGGFLTSGNGKKIPIVMGEQAAYQFYNTKKRDGWVYPYPDQNGKIPDPYVNVMKDEIMLRLGRSDEEKTKLVEYEVQVQGVLVADYSKGWETQDSIFMPIDEMNRMVAEYKKLNKIKESQNNEKGYQSAVVKTTDIKYVESVESYISETLGFSTNSMESIRKPMQQQIKQQSMVLGGLGLISLIVAAIGITNTMVMSIYERTREIGIMKVLGCEVPNIRTMFLTESGIIGLMGGIAGTIFSFGISWVINNWETIKMALGIAGGNSGMGGGFGMGMGGMMGMGGGKVSLIPPWLVAVAVIFGILIGLVSGFTPANRAVKISALEAIKHD